MFSSNLFGAPNGGAGSDPSGAPIDGAAPFGAAPFTPIASTFTASNVGASTSTASNAAGSSPTATPRPFGAAPFAPTPAADGATGGTVRSAVFARLITPEEAVLLADRARAEAEAEAAVARQAADPDNLGPTPPSPEEVAEAAHAEGLQRGYAEGYAEGLRRADEEQSEATRALTALVAGAAAEADGFIRAVEAEVVRLALAVAERVIEREARTDPELVLGVVRAAVAELEDRSEIHVRVSPADHALVESRWEELLPRSVARRSELLADEAVARGGCVVETRSVQVDAQLATKLAQITKTFGAVLDGEPA